MPMIDIETVYDVADNSRSTEQPNLAHKDALKDVLKAINEFLETKPPKYKEVFQEHFINELGYEETAAVVGIPCGSVKTIIHYIRKFVRNKYGKSYLSVA